VHKGGPESNVAPDAPSNRKHGRFAIHDGVSRHQSEALAARATAVEVTIRAKAPGLKRQATLRALRTTSATGTVTYTAVNSSGDTMLRREVIARFLSAESDTHKMAEIAVTPFNYRFRPNGFREEQDRRVYMFQLAPRKKNVGLFKGELWVDGKTGLPVHESGQFIKSPSVFIKRISFTRDYAPQDGLDIPVHTHSIVESRIVGRVELDIKFADPGASSSEEATHNAE
jgi:hypothetical protein